MMLKPSATKLTQSANTELLVAEFKARGGEIQYGKVAVASNLKKRKYLRDAGRKISPRFGE